MDFTDQCMSLLMDASEAAMREAVRRQADGVREAVSVPVEYTDTETIRSLPGEPPRRELGNLFASISENVTRRGDEVAGEVTVGGYTAPYAERLERGGGNVKPRPFMGPAFDRMAEDLPADLSADLARRLP